MRLQVLSVALLLAGCGYTGDPLPPALNIPEKITDLTGIQRGARVFVAFTPSLMSTDRMLLKELRSVELRIGPIPEGDFSLEAWLPSSRLIENVPAKGERTEVDFAVTELVGRATLVAVRAVGPSGRPGEWSNLLPLRIVEPPARPNGFRAESHPRGAVLRWDAAKAPEGAAWRVYRLAPEEKSAQMVAQVTSPEWVDPAAEEGKEYAYSLQLVVPSGTGEAESELSEVVRHTPIDRFPPAVPQALEAIPGVSTIELTWERSPESDTAGYVIFRAQGDAELQRLSGPVSDPSYSDNQVESRKTYRYAVAAIDRKGNLSRQSEPITISAP
jgi:hypothetical protein